MSENTACSNAHSAGKNCESVSIYGTFGPHKVKLACKYCLKFMGWGSAPQNTKPATNEQEYSNDVNEHRQTLLELLQNPQVSDFERGVFQTLVDKQEYMSAKQHDIFSKVMRKLKMPGLANKPTPVREPIAAFPPATAVVDPFADIPF